MTDKKVSSGNASLRPTDTALYPLTQLSAPKRSPVCLESLRDNNGCRGPESRGLFQQHRHNVATKAGFSSALCFSDTFWKWLLTVQTRVLLSVKSTRSSFLHARARLNHSTQANAIR